MSKMYERARDLIKEFPTREAFVAAAKEQLGMTNAGANTYYQNLMNAELACSKVGLDNNRFVGPAIGLALYTAIF